MKHLTLRDGHAPVSRNTRRPGHESGCEPVSTAANVAVLGCCDVDAPSGRTFGLPGEPIMSIRTVGSTLGEDVLGALEYACVIQGATVIVVLGHARCRAVAAACSETELGHLSGVLHRVGPAIHAIRSTAEPVLSEEVFLERVTREHVRRQAQAISQRSPVLARLCASGQLSVIAAVANGDGAAHAIWPGYDTLGEVLAGQLSSGVRH